MRSLFAVAIGAALVLAPGATWAITGVHTPGDAYPGTPLPQAGGNCTDDIFCANYTEPLGGFIADGEWNPSSGFLGFITTGDQVVVTNDICQLQAEFTTSVIDQVQRGFCWGTDPARHDFWTGTWIVPGTDGFLIHYEADGTEISRHSYLDPATGFNMQLSGLGMDYDNGHIWAILRNNHPGGGAIPVSRFVEFDANVPDGTAPTIIQGPIDVDWNGGPSTISSAGLEYNNLECTVVALRQDANNVNITELTVFQDVNPAGAGGATHLGFCNIPNQACSGAGQGINRPWGLAVVENPFLYAAYSDLNLAVGCGAIEQPGDFHVIAMPPVTGECRITAVEPSTWGKIKNSYR